MTAVLVIGGGIAGYCAAFAARRAGADVTVVARSPGATALYAGAMEIVDDLDSLLKSEPHHPFTRLGMDSVRLAHELDTAVHLLMLALEKGGLKFEGGWRERGLYADIHGIARPGNLVPATVAGGELRALMGRRVTVIGVKEVGDYDAESTALALKEVHGVEAVPEEVSIPDLPQAASLTDLYGRRAPQPRGRSTSIAYPPGFTNLPPDGFELLASPPSPHGWRLQQAIGLESVRAEVQSFDSTARVITAARAADRTFRADAFVLATGHHIGGGLTGGRLPAEPLLKLGVFHAGQSITSMGTRLQHLQYLDPAEELRSGVSTDQQLRPLDGEGQVAYENLYAAGAVLGGYDYAGTCGFGVPILTGWLAGRFAAKQP
ncbi:MAG TPA: FAD-dependent oxidoreductase [Candidatus Dormibacteraeota bacterium]|jgi:glycerol-3-phosphate dehydrogenase subunit B|nr:FAD-dependent oxidoreductase [Candidatus Dormibacteraeota bacterium]